MLMHEKTCVTPIIMTAATEHFCYIFHHVGEKYGMTLHVNSLLVIYINPKLVSNRGNRIKKNVVFYFVTYMGPVLFLYNVCKKCI